MQKNGLRGVRGRGAGRGAPPVAFGSVALHDASGLEGRARDLTGGARGAPAPLPARGDPFFGILLRASIVLRKLALAVISFAVTLAVFELGVRLATSR